MPATDSYTRNLGKMHGVFAISSVALFASTIWMMSADHHDEWRTVQATGDKIRAERANREKAAITTDTKYLTKSGDLEQKKKEADQALEQNKSKLNEVQKKVKAAELKHDMLVRQVREMRAERDVARANYDLKVRDEAPESVLEEFLKEYVAFQQKVDALERQEQDQSALVAQARAELRTLTDARDEIVADQKKLKGQIDALDATLAKVDPQGFSGIKRRLMDLPILDGFNSPTAIKQDWIKGLPIGLGMATAPSRFDRCRTCHVNIDSINPGPVPMFPHGPVESANYKDWVDAGVYPHPFSSHPNVALYAASQSPHKVETFGCTICHDGQGSGTSFSNASHTPNDPIIEKEWHHEHQYASNHFWEYPMFPKRILEATCLKCHHTVVELAVNPKFGTSAPKVTEGWHLIQKFGCFGCHEINGYDAGKSIGPDLRLEPQTAEEAKRIADDPTQVAGTMRKVGPSLRHVGSKLTPGFVQTWTNEPKAFRPTTRMPQFYHLSNQQDHDADRFAPIELAGISQYLFDKSEPLKLLSPKPGYVPDVQRGEVLFSQRGCLACHTHSGFKGATADFGPNLDKVHEKLPPDPDAEIGEVDGKKPGFSRWLYTWLRDPERHHPRTRMPNLFLATYDQKGTEVDPAADITAWLLKGGSKKFDALSFDSEGKDAESAAAADHVKALEDLARLNLARAITPRLADLALGGSSPQYPVGDAPTIKGDEIELVNAGTVVDVGEGAGEYAVRFESSPSKIQSLRAVWTSGEWQGRTTAVTKLAALDGNLWTVRFAFPAPKDAAPKGDATKGDPTKDDTAEKERKLPAKGDQLYVNGRITREMKLNYVGRKTISKYGCYGCHDVPGFETARPIGTALQDWGRKDPSRLAPEHIEEFLLHHGEPDGSSTHDRIERAIKRIEQGELTGEAGERERSAAYFYENLLHHGRPGFFWQKLREPRSYDFEKTETKGYDERLKMPKFPFDEAQIEAVATFVLGLVADPPPEKYLYRPKGAPAARLEGERLLEKYNCVGCHMLELPKFTASVAVEKLPYLKALEPADHPEALDLLRELKPPRSVSVAADKEGRGELTFQGTEALAPDPKDDPEEQASLFYIWETLTVNGRPLKPAARLNVGPKDLLHREPGRGGRFTEWLVRSLGGASPSPEQSDLAWQSSPPVLYREGIKVQTPWLYRFLKEPYQLRFTTVLRMPRFNMSDDEARALANYFAAADGTPFPYQDIPQRDRPYLSHMEALFPGNRSDDADYLAQSWKVLNNPALCINCHSVGGRDVQVDVKKPQPRGPNLEYAADRLRPDWTQLWLYNPKWITPYTSMPAQFSKVKAPVPELLREDGQSQAVGVRDALMNYPVLLERFGKTAAPPMPAANAGGD